MAKILAILLLLSSPVYAEVVLGIRGTIDESDLSNSIFEGQYLDASVETLSVNPGDLISIRVEGEFKPWMIVITPYWTTIPRLTERKFIAESSPISIWVLGDTPGHYRLTVEREQLSIARHDTDQFQISTLKGWKSEIIGNHIDAVRNGMRLHVYPSALDLEAAFQEIETYFLSRGAKAGELSNNLPTFYRQAIVPFENYWGWGATFPGFKGRTFYFSVDHDRAPTDEDLAEIFLMIGTIKDLRMPQDARSRSQGVRSVQLTARPWKTLRVSHFPAALLLLM